MLAILKLTTYNVEASANTISKELKMKHLACVVTLVMVLAGCSKSVDSLSKQALNQFLNENYRISSAVQLDKIKVLRAELTKTDLNYKHYRCLGLIKLKCIADSPRPIQGGTVNPGENYYQLVYVKLNFKEGPTGAVEAGSFDQDYINSKSGEELPISRINF